ncbi:P-loop containing nucleoside triphosphate hydrolase protein [Hyaloscypha sp. PMI_1271]|nr:P-loop containing nucleoside triphosphate hydrolase protein [Hyaloscypha sp. PMI_1271]
MIDTPMYKQVNPAAFPSRPPGEVIEAPTPEEMQTRSFFLLMPSEVFGHSMQTKKWVPLKVAYISPVVWNMEAFDSLVVDDDTKELVKALVTNQLAKEKGTDVLDGKGNGLVILLHGTLTLLPESVAELARKPLYRVTCGDIGTDATAVDKHLQIVLHLGRIWGCVVLLDEADVFLEERSLADMARNALVSVFLRVLEYYDGILILTSNRVGTFDEAFKSRIQLALHYDNLSRTQRRAIWANFIKRLASIEKDSVNTDSLTEHLDELAAHDMNGRQIRNSLTTARQLALYKGKKMDYGLLKHAIGVGSKFDHYLKGVKGNFSDDELAREGGVR